MKIRYIISENWKTKEISKVMQAIDFAVKYYKLDKGHLTVKLVNDIPEDATAERKRSNRYEVRIKPSKKDILLECVFHEMTHVKQFAKDGYRPRISSSRGFVEYMLTPQEMEARAMEAVLIHLFEEEQE